MKYAVVFTLLAAALAWAAISEAGGGRWWIAAIEGYLAIGLLALAIAYGLKQSGAAIEEVARLRRWTNVLHVVLAPYRLLAWICLALTRLVDREPSMSEVAPGLFVGRIPSGSESGRLGDLGIDAVLSLCAEFPGPRAGAANRVGSYVPILDGSPPTPRQLREAMDWLVARRSERLTVLIHCAQGHGRSATVAAVALCRLGIASNFDEAVDQIRSSRPKARPSKAQRAAAIRFLASVDPIANENGADHSTRPVG